MVPFEEATFKFCENHYFIVKTLKINQMSHLN